MTPPRAPTRKMITAGSAAIYELSDRVISRSTIAAAWKAMWDAAQPTPRRTASPDGKLTEIKEP